MKMLRACYDWRVLTGLAAVGVTTYLLAPSLLATALPVLLLAACPLSMLLMMKAMAGQPAASGRAPELSGGDRVAAVQRELAELRGRQEQLAAELRTVEATRADEGDAGQAPAAASSR